MAATGTTSQQQPPAAAVDPKFEWAEKAGTYVLRLTLTGFKKEDFRVQVDGAGRLTVRGTRPGASLHKVFQLPATASLDDIAGRFEAGVLTLTVPKRAGTAPPTSIEEVKKSKPGGVAKEENAKPTPHAEVDAAKSMPAKPTPPAEVDAAKSMPAKPTPPAEVDGAKKMPGEEGAAKLTPQAEVDGAKKMSKEEGAAKPPPTPASHQLTSKDSGAGKKETKGDKQPATRDDGGEKEAVVGTEPKESMLGKTTRQVAEYVHRMEEESRRKQIEHKPAPAAKKEEVKPKAPQPAAASATPDKPAPKAEVANGEDKAAVDRESQAERVRQCGEEERAKAAAAATAMETKAEQAKKAVASTCTAWKERIAGELKGLADMKWADNAVEMARKNKEVVAVGVAAFSIGFLVSQKLFRK